MGANRKGGRHPADAPRPVPRLRKHATGQAFARWRESGRERCQYFGRWGTLAANGAYRRWAARWAAGGAPAAVTPAGGVSVADLLARWVVWCGREYTKFGRPTSMLHQCRRAAVLVNAACGELLASEVTPQHVADAQRAWADTGIRRLTVRLYRMRAVQAFRWGVGAGLVAPAVAAALREVPHLKPGRTAAAEPAGRRAVAWEIVERTLLQFPADSVLRSVVLFQWHTGCRGVEACALRPCDLSDVDGVRVYTVPPHANKNHHRGKVQWYAIGPRAAAALAPHLNGAADRPAFGLTRRAYQVAIRRACEAAGIPRWTPHQLRHSFATQAAILTGSLDAAAAGIGDTAAVARGYVHCDPQAAAKIDLARRIG